MDVLEFLIPVATGLCWAGVGLYHLTTHNNLRQRGVRAEAQVIGPVPGAPASRSRRRGVWVINPMLSFTTPDGRSVQQPVGSKNRPIRVREDAQVTLFHARADHRQLVVDGHGVRGRAYADIVLGVSLAVIILLLMSDAF
ncbi:DUF3592 domain-containing protein [Streptomyces phaeochromogenes]|uniref:DUF3592 domain-containing protein n=1 Tax=Streptomyces phaeochromogenes TaxID=1923 RepID=UPI00369DC11C